MEAALRQRSRRGLSVRPSGTGRGEQGLVALQSCVKIYIVGSG